MSITSLLFITVALPLFLACYYISPQKLRPYVLVLLSVFFYSLTMPSNTIILLISVAENVLITYLLLNDNIEKKLKKILLFIGVVSDVLFLGVYKYSDFAIDNANWLFGKHMAHLDLIVPMGISFFTFRAISLVVDTYKGKVKKFNLIEMINYLIFFGHIQMGPISRYDQFKPSDKDKGELFRQGIIRFVAGFGKKMILANPLSNISAEVFDAGTYSTSLSWLASVCFCIQLFLDFSGYSDMAIGVANMFGYDCAENFNYPYISRTFGEYWKRWHITMGDWFRDYVYFPLGGSRCGVARGYFNLFVVWVLTGIWHGAGWDFIAWGMVCYVLNSFEKITKIQSRLNTPVKRVLYQIVAIILIDLQTTVFRCSSFPGIVGMIGSMFRYQNIDNGNGRALFLLGDYWFFILIGGILCTPVVPVLKEKLCKDERSEVCYRIVEGIVMVCVFILSISFVVCGSNSPFVYANF